MRCVMKIISMLTKEPKRRAVAFLRTITTRACSADHSTSPMLSSVASLILTRVIKS